MNFPKLTKNTDLKYLLSPPPPKRTAEEGEGEGKKEKAKKKSTLKDFVAG